ncbi:Flp pilus assembly protein CpaB [Heyndrickxia sporothermodurans]
MLESKRRAMIFLLLAFILAAVAGYLVFDKVRSLNSELGGMTKIYVAAGDIPSRTLITKNQLKTMEIPNRYVTKSNITNINELTGKVLVVPASNDDILTKNMLKPVSNLREENDRLVAMYRSDKIQFDQVVEALDRVDIIVSTEEDGKKKTELFMKDVPVAWAQGSGKDFAGAALEVRSEYAPKLIHMQNFATHIRILKANVGKDDIPVVKENKPTDQSKNPEQKRNTQEAKKNNAVNSQETKKNENTNTNDKKENDKQKQSKNTGKEKSDKK